MLKVMISAGNFLSAVARQPQNRFSDHENLADNSSPDNAWEPNINGNVGARTTILNTAQQLCFEKLICVSSA